MNEGEVTTCTASVAVWTRALEVRIEMCRRLRIVIVGPSVQSCVESHRTIFKVVVVPTAVPADAGICGGASCHNKRLSRPRRHGLQPSNNSPLPLFLYYLTLELHDIPVNV